MGDIRRFKEEDAVQVADLFQKILRHSDAAAPASLAPYFADVFCRHPWSDPDIGSLVYVSPEGKVRGFIGVLAVPMLFRGRQIRAAYAGSLMVDAPAQDPLAGARLLRAYLSGPQDLSISETANQTSAAMWQKLGGQIVACRSLDWVRILRPLTFAATVGARRLPALAMAGPVTAALDRVVARFLPPLPDVSAGSGHDVTPAALADLVEQLAQGRALHPAFDRSVLAFLIKHASNKESRGLPIARIVHDRRGKPVGGYLAHGGKHRIMRVLQVFASLAQAEPIMSDLFSFGAQIGAAAVMGQLQPEIIGSLQGANCLYFLRAATVVHSRDAELLAAVNGSDTMLNGLAGESWIRLVGGTFD